jgi:hypothetical protein
MEREECSTHPRVEIMGLPLEIATSDEWHVLKGETQYGPYTYEEMIRLMQNKTVFSFDYVWSPHLESWTAVADLAEFSPDRLRSLVEKSQAALDEQNAFNRREHERVYCQLPVYINDQQTLWEGTAENLSEGGALILMKNPVLLPGHIVHVHFRSRGPQGLSFNCTAEILTKRLIKQRIQHDTGIHYAVKFLQKSAMAEKQIQTLIQEFKKEKNSKS